MTLVAAWPIRRDDTGALALVDSDSVERVVQDVTVLCRTRRGERTAVPDLGVSLLPGGRSVDLADLRAQIDRHVPDAALHDVTATQDADEPWVVHVTVETAGGT